jgi:hypothetical protein
MQRRRLVEPGHLGLLKLRHFDLVAALAPNDMPANEKGSDAGIQKKVLIGFHFRNCNALGTAIVVPHW